MVHIDMRSDANPEAPMPLAGEGRRGPGAALVDEHP